MAASSQHSQYCARPCNVPDRSSPDNPALFGNPKWMEYNIVVVETAYSPTLQQLAPHKNSLCRGGLLSLITCHGIQNQSSKDICRGVSYASIQDTESSKQSIFSCQKIFICFQFFLPLDDPNTQMKELCSVLVKQ
ncbi:Uncharacterized protein Fot_43819 [Forsythia ovata]|uniref:Uncharacterized protein n=1 Tax=Forsythia ovata TaxID=205694 RepID=A0ABD1R1Q4_9LAMI